MAGSTLIFDLITRDQASAGFKRAGDAAVLAATKIGKAQTSVERAAIRMNSVGKSLTKSLTLPIAAAAAVSVDQAAKYQAGLNTIRVATDQTNKQMAVSSKGLLNIAKSTGTSLDQLTDSLYTVEKGGLRGQKALDAVRAAAQGARAESADLGTATSALTSIMASYGKSLGNPVQAENALIRGAGLAKTTYQDFAASLSNVVPLAASLHISFSQVAGAVDTMTQHGESAQRATENLNNLIRNLAGSNNVAVKAMSQLGLKSQDVAKTLGKQGPGGGLSGALNMVESAMAHSSHGGMIVISAFKQAQNATHDLQVELAHMPPQLENISRQFLAGKLGYQDYYSAVKSLGGQAYVMGKQFISSVQGAKGFSDALRSGNPQVQTAAQAFQKLLGGSTGMNAALMLSGNSAKTFADDAKSVGDASRRAGGDVLGWSQTQNTFAVRLAKAKESLQVLAVEVGTELLPALSKLASAGEKAIGWVSGLDHTQKEILGWGIGIVAAIGPVMSITSKLMLVGSGISKFTTLATTQLAAMAGASEESAASIGMSMSRITTGLASAGLGVAAGELTKNSNTATKAVGVLGSALAGAAIGSAGGPAGMAIGALAGGVGDLAVQYFHSGDAAKDSGAKAQAAAQRAAQAVQAEKQAVQGLLSGLEAVNGQYGKQYRNSVIQTLQQQGVLSQGQKLGLNASTITDAALGKNKAQVQILTELHKRYPLLTSDVTGFLAALDKTTGETGSAEKAYEQYIAAQGRGVVSAKQLSGGLKNLGAELNHHGTALTTDSDKTVAASAFAARNSAVLRANIQAISANATAHLRAGDSVSSVANKFMGQVSALQASTKSLGFNANSVSGLIAKYGALPAKVITYLQKQGVTPAVIQAIVDRYNALPKSKTTTVAVSGAAAAQGQIDGIIAGLQAMHNRVITVTTQHVNADGTGTSHTVHAQAAGTRSVYGTKYIPPNQTFTVGERGWEGGVSDAQGRVSIFSNAQSKVMGFRTPVGYASGTGSNKAAIASLLASMGATKAGIAGFLGNTQVESGFRTTAYNPGENAHGFQQWEGGRLTVLQHIASKLGTSITSQAAQLAMIKHELTHGYGDTLNVLRHATSARQAAAYVDANYERSSGDARQQRMNDAARIMASGIGKVIDKVSTGGGGASSISRLTQKQINKVIGAGGYKTPSFSLGSVARAAAHAVTGGITGATKPQPTGPAAAARDLAASTASATKLTQVSMVANKTYDALASHADKLKKQLADLRDTQRGGMAAARNHATALSNEAHKASEAASAMPAKTKADKAAKAAAEAHARALSDAARAASTEATVAGRSGAQIVAALQKRATAAAAAASKEKDAWGKAQQAAKAAAQAAQDAAKNLVDVLTSRVSALADAVSGFKQSISQGITAGSDLATLWGKVTDAASTATDNLTSANQNLADAQQSVLDAQKAISDAAPDTASLVAAQNAQAQAAAQYASAHTALLAAQAAVAAGQGTAAQYAALTSAQAQQTNTLAALAAANNDLASAQQAVAQASGPSQDQLDALTTAQTNLAAATKAASDAAAAAASQTGSYANLQTQFNTTLAATQKFAGDLTALTKAGAGQDLVSQIAAMGVDAGDALAQQLLAAGPSGIKALQDSMSQIANVADSESTALAKGFYNAGATALQNLVSGMEKRFPDIKAALDPLVKQLQAMFTFTPTVVVPGASSATNSTGSSTKTITISGHTTLAALAKQYNTTVTAIDALNPSLSKAGGDHAFNSGVKVTVPGFAGGVSNYSGGLAYVHANELLTYMPRGTNVHTKSETKNIFDNAEVVSELREIKAHLATAPADYAAGTTAALTTSARATSRTDAMKARRLANRHRRR